MFFNSHLQNQAKKILQIAEERGLKITTAESCTGGLVSSLLTEIAGSSAVFERGFVTYSNCAKNELLGVKKEILEEFGAVSKETAEEMAKGAIENSKADISVAITGIAGPNSDSTSKPVGLVYITTSSKVKIQSRKFNFAGNRNQIRESSLISVLSMLENAIRTH